jgi:formylglycine-generating enzyme required for sulfatase activity
VDLSQTLQQWMQQPTDASRLDQICDDFEEQLLKGLKPVVEQFLAQVPESTHHELLCQLLSIETYHRQQAGDLIDWQNYLQRFPEEAEWINRIASRQMNQSSPVATVLSFHPGTGPTESRQDLSGSFVSRRAVGDFRNGRYRLLSKLGEGSFGTVYLCVDDDLRRRVALKVPKPEALARLIDVDLYLREAQIAASLDHPNIVPVYDVGRAIDGSVYVVSKLVEGQSLGEYIQQHQPDDRAMAKMLAKVADALHHAHSRKLIHRDIKPANILIDVQTDEPYVTDFGLSIRAEDPGLGTELAGSPAYMSPEQLRGERSQLDGRSDLFSLGVVMYQSLSGRLPFEGKTRDEVAREILETEPLHLQRIRSDVPPELERICWKLLRKDPADRYQSGEKVARDLHYWANPNRRRQGWMTAGLGAMLAALFLTMVWFAGNEKNRQSQEAARGAVAELLRVPFQQMRATVERLGAMRPRVDPLLKQTIEGSAIGSEERLRLTLAMLPTEPALAGDLARQLLSIDAKRLNVLLDALQPHAQALDEFLWKEAENGNDQTLLQSACALARFASGSARWSGIERKVSDRLASLEPEALEGWLPYLDSVGMRLVPPLLQIALAQPGKGGNDRAVAATRALERYAANDFETLHQIIIEGQPWQFSQCFEEYQKFRDQAIQRLGDEVAKKIQMPFELPFGEMKQVSVRSLFSNAFKSFGKTMKKGYQQVGEEVAKTVGVDTDANRREAIERAELPKVRRQANAVIALVRFGVLQPAFEFLTVDFDSEATSQFVDGVEGRLPDCMVLLKGLEELTQQSTPDNQPARQQHFLRIYAFLLGIGSFGLEVLPESDRDRWIDTILRLYSEHPSRAVHSASGWVLRRWGKVELAQRVEQKEIPYDRSGRREWFVMRLGPPVIREELMEDVSQISDFSPTDPIWMTMMVFPSGFPGMLGANDATAIGLDQTVAVSDREVTWRQYSPLDLGFRRIFWQGEVAHAISLDTPVFGINWFEAIYFCRWLTEVAGWKEDKQSYEKRDQTFSIVGWFSDEPDTEWPVVSNRPGFRLPNEKEWEIIARAGMMTPYSFGRSAELIERFGWCQEHSDNQLKSVAMLRPSIGGLFDIHGNVQEWTNDSAGSPMERIFRGGAANTVPAICRSATRSAYISTSRNGFVGIRVVMNPDSMPNIFISP